MKNTEEYIISNKSTEIIQNKSLNYYQKNAENNYLKTPISVLRYIDKLENKIKILYTIRKLMPWKK